MLFFFKVLAAIYCDVDQEVTKNLGEEKVLLVI